MAGTYTLTEAEIEFLFEGLLSLADEKANVLAKYLEARQEPEPLFNEADMGIPDILNLVDRLTSCKDVVLTEEPA